MPIRIATTLLGAVCLLATLLLPVAAPAGAQSGEPAAFLTLSTTTAGWVIVDGDRQWIDADCREQLAAAGASFSSSRWSVISSFPKVTTRRTCDQLRAFVSTGDHPSFVTNSAGNSAGWALVDGTRQWLSSSCRTQLEDAGATFSVTAWSAISSNPKTGNPKTCDQLEQLVEHSPNVQCGAFVAPGATVSLTGDLTCSGIFVTGATRDQPVTIQMNGFSITGSGGAAVDTNVAIVGPGSIVGYDSITSNRAFDQFSASNVRLAGSIGGGWDEGRIELVESVVELGGAGVDCGVAAASIEIQRSQIRNSDGSGVCGHDVLIANSTVSGSKLDGVRVDYTLDSAGNLTMTNSTVSDNGRLGINLGYGTRSSISGSDIRNNGASGVLFQVQLRCRFVCQWPDATASISDTVVAGNGVRPLGATIDGRPANDGISLHNPSALRPQDPQGPTVLGTLTLNISDVRLESNADAGLEGIGVRIHTPETNVTATGNGDSVPCSGVSCQFDNVDVYAPENATATRSSSSTVVLEWTEATHSNPLREYEITRDGVWYGWTPAGNLTWTDHDATGTHTYRIRAIDQALNYSAYTQALE